MKISKNENLFFLIQTLSKELLKLFIALIFILLTLNFVANNIGAAFNDNAPKDLLDQMRVLIEKPFIYFLLTTILISLIPIYSGVKKLIPVKSNRRT